jgi:hypothetical protein
MAEPPRSREQRIADTMHHLEHDVDAWLATTDSQRPWLVPLSFIWHDGRLVFATDESSRTIRNAKIASRVRIALGATRDVVLIDGDAAVTPSSDMSDAEVDAYRGKNGSDPRGWADSILRVSPQRVQAWREENELRGRTLMRDGVWLSTQPGEMA